MDKHLLEVDSVICNIGDRQLLTDVYLKCRTGDIIGLLGRNGCGKTTLLRIIFGTKHTDHKFIRIDGQVYQHPYKQGNLIGYLPQESFLPQGLSLQKIAGLFLSSYEKRQKVFEHERIKQHLKKEAGALSTGERRYFELLLLLQLDVKFLLLDEPFAGLEPLCVERIQDLLTAYCATKGFIITDHNYRSVVGVGTALILLADGACRHIKHPEELVRWGYAPAGNFS